MIDYRIPIILLYILCCIVFCCQNTLCIKKFCPQKIIKILDMSRFFPYWKLFLGMSPLSFDIKITARSDKNTYEWFLRKNKNVCGVDLLRNISRLTLTFYYDKYCYIFLNTYFLNSTKSLLTKKGESLDSFIIEKIFFDSYSTKIDSKKVLFSYPI